MRSDRLESRFCALESRVTGLERRMASLWRGMDGIARSNHRIETMLADSLTRLSATGSSGGLRYDFSNCGERYKGAIKTLHGPDKRDRSDDLDVAACAIGHHADAEMALGALLAAAEWHADSGADVFGHLVKRPFNNNFYVCTDARYGVMEPAPQAAEQPITIVLV